MHRRGGRWGQKKKKKKIMMMKKRDREGRGEDGMGGRWEPTTRVAVGSCALRCGTPKLRGSRGVIAASDINPWLHGSKHGHQIDYQSRRDQSSMGSTKRQSAGGTTCREPEEQTMGCDLFASLQGSGKARSMLEKKKGINGNITIENTYICPNAGVS